MQDKPRMSAVRQCRMNTLAAKHLHERRLARLRGFNSLVDYLAISVPVLYFPIRYLAKNTTYSTLIEPAWEILAAALLIITILKMALRWQERAEQHSKLIAENISLAGQARHLLTANSNISQDSIRWFLLLAENCEKSDRDVLGTIDDEERKLSYREALKEFDPDSIDTRCPKCDASTWDYKPGTCQLCGNTPNLLDSSM